MDAAPLARRLWADLGGDPAAPDRLTVSGPHDALPSSFPVTAAAAAAVAVATLAAAEVWSRRGGPPAPAVAVDTRHAALACRSEHYVTVVGDDLGGVWDPIAGAYRAADGWVRLHTNFRAHRAAAVRVLGLTGGIDSAAVARAVARWRAVALEDAVHAAGGCAAALRPIAEWRASDQAAALTARPLVAVDDLDGPPAPPDAAPHGRADRRGWSRPLDGLRVLDLTRVIAGPVAGRFLAAHGADVLRVDGPAAEDSRVLVADTTVGKRATVLDIGTTRGAETFADLLDRADAVLCAYRPGALAGLGLAPGVLAAQRPGLVVGTLSAWGGIGVGPWGGRRGFDSLVQMASGIAGAGLEAGEADRPTPLPLQLLDHATARLLALGVIQALRARRRQGGTWTVRTSLAGTAAWLEGLGRVDALDVPEPDAATVDRHRTERPSAWGRLRYVRPAGTIGGRPLEWARGPEPPGSSAARWWLGPGTEG
jgi:crotonobetainyl-CoA:carnitine CoA-transferase CaiB-like acyl-CoA transferase